MFKLHYPGVRDESGNCAQQTKKKLNSWAYNSSRKRYNIVMEYSTYGTKGGEPYRCMYLFTIDIFKVP